MEKPPICTEKRATTYTFTVAVVAVVAAGAVVVEEETFIPWRAPPCCRPGSADIWLTPKPFQESHKSCQIAKSPRIMEQYDSEEMTSYWIPPWGGDQSSRAAPMEDLKTICQLGCEEKDVYMEEENEKSDWVTTTLRHSLTDMWVGFCFILFREPVELENMQKTMQYVCNWTRWGFCKISLKSIHGKVDLFEYSEKLINQPAGDGLSKPCMFGDGFYWIYHIKLWYSFPNHRG